MDVIRKGANYGYSEREGNQMLLGPDNTMTSLPTPDEIPVRITDTITNGTVVPTYPVIQYPHTAAGGDAIAGGFVYRGKALPALQGKYVFGDISTGKIWYADYKEMLAADDGNPATMAALHEVHLRWNAPGEAAEALLELATGGTPSQPERVAPAVDPFEHPDAQRRFRVNGQGGGAPGQRQALRCRHPAAGCGEESSGCPRRA